MSEGFPIENASKKDLQRIVILLQDTDLPPDGIEPHVDDFLVIRSSHAVAGPEFLIGCVGLEVYENYALLRSLAVHPDFQRKGIGKQLVSRIIERAKVRGIDQLYLLTDTAEDFFRRLEFELVARQDVPAIVRQSIEFTTLCPSAPSMTRRI
ncbi:MAG: arsenic resistance N-acetyltransferase ArsN2 [Candidatus Thorarchaeota archaeon]|jgi:amino-acid N-acetyltransferase